MSIQETFSPSFKKGLRRRQFLRVMLWAAMAGCSTKSVLAAVENPGPVERCICLYNPKTKECFNGVYWRGGSPVAEALQDINHIMRDTRTGDVKSVDIQLLDLIAAMATELETSAPFHVISGYRSPKTNDILRRQSNAVAKNSFHIKGQAADIRLPGLKTAVLRKAASKLKMGGVGYYPHRRFVHVDVGPIRYWNGKG
jgi:uncharacterized protein YcbK (DUF882 family)